jgi:hypothetical protein
LNTGGIRFDLLRGNFTLNDEKTVSPFKNAFFVLNNVQYGDAKILLDWLNTGRWGYILGGEDDIYNEALLNSWEKYHQQEQQHTFTIPAPEPGYVTYDGSSSSSAKLINRLRI